MVEVSNRKSTLSLSANSSILSRILNVSLENSTLSRNS